MATALNAGLSPRQALELSRSGLRSKALAELVAAAKARCDEGMPLSEALEPGRNLLPSYFLPVVRVGERSGRLVEAFQLLSQHSQQIAPSLRLIRNTWFYPVACVLFGWVVRIGIFLYFGKPMGAWYFFWDSFGTAAFLVAVGWWLYQGPKVRRGLDVVLLHVPLVRETEIRMALVLFFSTFRLAYEAGAIHALSLFDLSLETIRNTAIRRDFSKAREVLDQNGTFGDAFDRVSVLDMNFKGLIHAGSTSGKLDESLAKIVERATGELQFSLTAFNQVFLRLVVFLVAMAIVETVLLCTF